jgi:hypothetical protein
MDANDKAARGDGRKFAAVLALLAAAFLLRVLGQLLVLWQAPSWLPPMEQWYSGLLPYPLLLPCQLLILVLQAVVFRDLRRGRGWFAERRPRLGRGLRRFAWIYAGAMLLRYVIVMTRFPGRHWLDGTIPIVFHWVLACWLWVLSRYHESTAQERP